MGMWQSALDAIYPPTCALCDAETATTGGLCGPCWREMPFVTGCRCDLCGVPLPGAPAPDGASEHCDDCLATPRPWSCGRAALVYRGSARSLALKLKHADRLDLVAPAAGWMASAAQPIWPAAPLLVPVPLGRGRLLRRRYNQAALLALALARATGHGAAPLALSRIRRALPRHGSDRAARFQALAGAFAPHPRHGRSLAGRNVVVIDDVMTTGATLAAAAEAARAGGASDVRVLALARRAKDA